MNVNIKISHDNNTFANISEELKRYAALEITLNKEDNYPNVIINIEVA